MPFSRSCLAGPTPDRICVLRRGKQIGVRETPKTDKNEIVSMITGLR